MTFSTKLLEKLACPSCKQNLEYNENENRLDCNACGLGFPIENDIPILLVNEAKKLK